MGNNDCIHTEVKIPAGNLLEKKNHPCEGLVKQLAAFKMLTHFEIMLFTSCAQTH